MAASMLGPEADILASLPFKLSGAVGSQYVDAHKSPQQV